MEVFWLPLLRYVITSSTVVFQWHYWSEHHKVHAVGVQDAGFYKALQCSQLITAQLLRLTSG